MTEMEVDWREDGINPGGRVLFIYNFKQVWPGVGGSPRAALLRRLPGGKWDGTYWGRCRSWNTGEVPECDTLEEAQAVVLMLLRLDS